MSVIPELSLGLQAIVRELYSLLMLGTLIISWPNRKFFFGGKSSGGYVESDAALYSPLAINALIGIWAMSLVFLLLGQWLVLASTVNLVLCYHFFIQLRWRSLLRGMGAPGFMSWWLAAFVFLAELALAFAPSQRHFVLFVFQYDFAIIMLSAGIYKLTSGYLHNHGMQLGLVNPMWGYWYKFYRRFSPKGLLFNFYNQMGWGTEVVCAGLMLVPATRFWGGLIMALSFVFIMLQIRLGLLCGMIIVSCLLFMDGQGELTSTLAPLLSSGSVGNEVATVAILLNAFLWFYVIMRPLVLMGLYINFYGERALPQPIQRTVEWLSNTFGIILWRVFTREITGFYIEIESVSKARTPLARYDSIGDWRFNHVGESIAVTVLFTTLKYFGADRTVFRDKLLRYARTLSLPDGKALFRWVQFTENEQQFETAVVVEFDVNLLKSEVVERIVNPQMYAQIGMSSAAAKSCVRPGSYVPVAAGIGPGIGATS